jgi:hypothetical protein
VAAIVPLPLPRGKREGPSHHLCDRNGRVVGGAPRRDCSRAAPARPSLTARDRRRAGARGVQPGSQTRRVVEPPTSWFVGESSTDQGASGVEDWRGGREAPFPVPAHRTGHADLPHPALGQDVMLSPTDGSWSRAPGARDPGERRSTRPGSACSRSSSPCACGTTTGAADGSRIDPALDSSY